MKIPFRLLVICVLIGLASVGNILADDLPDAVKAEVRAWLSEGQNFRFSKKSPQDTHVLAATSRALAVFDAKTGELQKENPSSDFIGATLIQVSPGGEPVAYSQGQSRDGWALVCSH